MMKGFLCVLAGLLGASQGAAEEDGRYRLPAGGFGVLAQGAPQAVPSTRLREEQRFGRFEDTVALRAGWFVRQAQVTGRLDSETAKREGGEAVAFTCTATAIAKDLILTNAHCVKHKGDERAVKLSFFPEFRDGRRDPEDAAHAVDLTPVERGTGQMDYAIYRLKRPLAGYAAPSLGYRAVMAGEPLVIIGHPEAQPLKLSRGGCQSDPEVPTKGVQIVHSCATRQGSSGSLVFGLDGSVVGLHHIGGANIGGRAVGYAVSMAALVEKSPTLRQVLSDAATRPQALQVARSRDTRGAEGLCLLGVDKKDRVQDAFPIVRGFKVNRLYVDIADSAGRFLSVRKTAERIRYFHWGRRGQVYGKETIYLNKESEDYPTPMLGAVPEDYAKYIESDRVHRMAPVVAAIEQGTGLEYWVGLTLLNSSSQQPVFDALANAGFLTTNTCLPVEDIAYIVDTTEGIELTVAEYLERVRVASP
ncbi:trypsin-like serine peptidase [Pacificoceanicola onchidii]|uniref:trypsin-like serine peptidase n=1 Tax=Pacificoceanicola onchidii TaxID=2562685 RepID=UPI0010A61F5B|nr:serine protease [Pacificoceanicola onchidii]